MTSFRIQVMQKTLSNILEKNLQFAFSSLKFSIPSVQMPELENSIPGDTFQTSTQARNVLLKSENLCRRVSLLVDRLGSQMGSQDSYESVSSRLNLHIPRGSLINTPMSPLSMGELDTDRISNKVEEVESQLQKYDLILTIWKSWKNWANRKIYARENKVMAQDFWARKVLRKIFARFKDKYRKTVKSKEKIVLAQGSYVQKMLRRVLGVMGKWACEKKERKKVLSEVFMKRKKKVLKAWKNVAGVLKGKWKKVREYRRKWNKKVLMKYFKYFVIISMIIQRVNKQKSIASSFNRDRLLKLGFKHLSLSIFTNKYYNSLNTLSLNYYEKSMKKKYFDLFYMKILTQKRIKVVKNTGIRLFRRSSLTKAMQKLYSFYSYSKQHRQQSQNSQNYYTSNLYLKTLVSWQSYHKTNKLKNKKNIKAREFFKKKNIDKNFKAWKKLTPKLKHLRSAKESIEKEKNCWMLKEILLDWLARTKERIDKKTVFDEQKNLKVAKKCFLGWKTYWQRKIEKNEKFYEKSEKIEKNWAKRVFGQWKMRWQQRHKIQIKRKKLERAKVEKIYKKWRILFLRKITLTPLVLKRNFLYIWRRWKKFVQSTASEFKKEKKANQYNIKRRKQKLFKRWKLFLYKSQQYFRIFSHCSEKRGRKTAQKLIKTWKSFTLSSRLKNLKLAQANNHFLYSQKLKVFEELKKYQDFQLNLFENLTKEFKTSLVTKRLIVPNNNPKNFTEHKNIDGLFLKSQGISQWFLNIQQAKNRSNDISSILSNSLKIEVSEKFFNKEAVQAVQNRRKKTAKRILAFWRQFVDMSKRKYKSALNHYKNKLKIKLKSCYLSWKHQTSNKLKYRTLLKAAQSQLSKYKQIKSIKAWKFFWSNKKIQNKRIQIVTNSRLSIYLATIVNYWKSYAKYRMTLKKMIKNFLTIRRAKLVFGALKMHLCSKLKMKNLKAENFFVIKFFESWIKFVQKNRKNRREKNVLNEKAQEFFNDFGCVRALRRLKQHAEARALLKKANQVFFENAFKKVFSRWSGLHERYLKKMRLARKIESEKIEKKKSFCLKKWFYVSHLNSWKNRAEKRLFFYWDRRLKRILFTWKQISGSRLSNYDKIWQFRKTILEQKSFKALKGQKSYKINKKLKQQHSENLKNRIFLRRVFTIIQKFHEYSRFKLKKLTKALNFCYSKTCEKFLSAWSSHSKHLRAKKGKLKKNFSYFIRNSALKKFNLTPIQISNMFKSGFSDDFEHLQHFWKSLSRTQVKGRDYQTVSIFIKWRSLVGCKSIANYKKTSKFYEENLKKKSFKAWVRSLAYAKSRRKTLRSAIIFHRTSLKKRVFNKWKPKKMIRRGIRKIN